MTVLLVLATSAGGTGRHVAQLAAGLSRLVDEAGRAVCRVVVAGPVATGRDFGFPLPGTEFEVIEISSLPRPLADRRAIHQLRVLAAGVDVLHAHGLRAGALAVLAVRRLPITSRPKVVITLHNALISRGRTAAVHGALERIVARGADVVLVISADVGETITARGARDVRPAVVPAPALPPPSRSVEEVRHELGLTEGTALLVTVGRLAQQKGLVVLIDAVQQLIADGLKVSAVVAGEGPLADSLAKRAALHKVPLSLLGPRDDVADLIAAADLVVVPSLWEGQPLIVQEALVAGAAIVATDSGGTATVAGDGAVMVPPGRPAELAEAIACLLRDPQARAQLRLRAVARGRQLPSAQEALQQVLTIYRSLI